MSNLLNTEDLIQTILSTLEDRGDSVKSGRTPLLKTALKKYIKPFKEEINIQGKVVLDDLVKRSCHLTRHQQRLLKKFISKVTNG